MRNAVRASIVAPAILVLLSGCATKGWVTDFFQKRQIEVDQRIGTVEGRLAAEGSRLDAETQRVDSLGVRVLAVENSAAVAGDTARAARERADQAIARADAADSRLTRLWQNRHKRQVVETVNVHFGFDRSDLDDRGQTALIALVKDMRENSQLAVDLMGYTDPVGPRGYNLELSRRRVEAVRRYLVEQGIELGRIHSIGLGPIMDQGKPNADKRRVTVTLTLPAE